MSPQLMTIVIADNGYYDVYAVQVGYYTALTPTASPKTGGSSLAGVGRAPFEIPCRRAWFGPLLGLMRLLYLPSSR